MSLNAPLPGEKPSVIPSTFDEEAEADAFMAALAQQQGGA